MGGGQVDPKVKEYLIAHGLWNRVISRRAFLKAHGMPASVAREQAIKEALGEIEGVPRAMGREMSNKGLKEIEKDENSANGRSYLALYEAAEDRDCTTAEAVAWARRHFVAAQEMGKLDESRWAALLIDVPSQEAVGFLQTLASGKVDIALVTDALKKREDEEDQAEVAMEKDAERIIKMCKDRLKDLVKEVDEEVAAEEAAEDA
jgi:hypothetical protein